MFLFDANSLQTCLPPVSVLFTTLFSCPLSRFLYTRARNQANNAVKLAKKRYVSDNLNASKGNSRNTWKVINELTSRKAAFTRQTKVGKLALANSSWCV